MQAPRREWSSYHKRALQELTSISVEQLGDNLKSLRRDSEKLDALVRKYDKIHDEGPGRRLLFTLKESSGLTDLRRRIGLHEQTLQLWYMTLVYGSLRRLEGGHEEILKAIDAIKDWSPRKVREVRRSLYRGDAKPLEHELRKAGVRTEVEGGASLSCAAEYVMADPNDKVDIESRARVSSKLDAESRRANYDEKDWFPPPTDFLVPGRGPSDIRRSKSTGHGRPIQIVVDGEPRGHERPPGSAGRYEIYNKEEEKVFILPNRSRRPRRSSEEPKGPLRSPLLVVPDAGPKYRSSSTHSAENHKPPRSPDRKRQDDDRKELEEMRQHLEEERIRYETERQRLEEERRRFKEDSRSRAANREQVIVIPASQSQPRRSPSQRSNRSDLERRDSSTHSFYRVRRSSASEEGEGAEKIRMVTKMDRIDSIDPPSKN